MRNFAIATAVALFCLNGLAVAQEKVVLPAPIEKAVFKGQLLEKDFELKPSTVMDTNFGGVSIGVQVLARRPIDAEELSGYDRGMEIHFKAGKEIVKLADFFFNGNGDLMKRGLRENQRAEFRFRMTKDDWDGLRNAKITEAVVVRVQKK